jgi:hypothetical protein
LTAIIKRIARSVLGDVETSIADLDADVTALTADVAGKADAVHTHIIDDTTGLQAALDGKAALAHAHAQADITGLVADLAGKASASHTHPASDISDSTAAGRTLLTAANAAAQKTALAITLDDLADAAVSGAAEGQALVHNGTQFANLTLQTVTLGPWHINDLPATATTVAGVGYYNTSSAVSLVNTDLRMDLAGRVVGVIIASDDARTAGTATARVRVNGASTAFNAGAVALDGTNTLTDSAFVAWGSGVAFAAGDTLGVAVQTSSWAPTTANVAVWLVVALKF